MSKIYAQYNYSQWHARLTSIKLWVDTNLETKFFPKRAHYYDSWRRAVDAAKAADIFTFGDEKKHKPIDINDTGVWLREVLASFNLKLTKSGINKIDIYLEETPYIGRDRIKTLTATIKFQNKKNIIKVAVPMFNKKKQTTLEIYRQSFQQLLKKLELILFSMPSKATAKT